MQQPPPWPYPPPPQKPSWWDLIVAGFFLGLGFMAASVAVAVVVGVGLVLLGSTNGPYSFR